MDRTAAHAAAALALICLPIANAAAQAAEADAAPPGRTLTGSLTGYAYALPDAPNFGMAVGSVNLGALRFEGRYNYEARASASAFVGWKFAGGTDITWEVTPILGTLWGRSRGTIPGVEASVAYKAFDFYTEAELVLDHNSADDNYVYAWTELGWRPLEWLRLGLVAQRTRVVNNDRDLQRGVLVQAFVGKVTLSGYAFNPDNSSRYGMLAIGVGF